MPERQWRSHHPAMYGEYTAPLGSTISGVAKRRIALNRNGVRFFAALQQLKATRAVIPGVKR